MYMYIITYVHVYNIYYIFFSNSETTNDLPQFTHPHHAHLCSGFPEAGSNERKPNWQVAWLVE